MSDLTHGLFCYKDVARGQWNLLKQRFFKTTTTRDSKCHWAVLNMGASMLSGKDPVENLVIEFMDCANNLGSSFP
jgi:hypothetical protein